MVQEHPPTGFHAQNEGQPKVDSDFYINRDNCLGCNSLSSLSAGSTTISKFAGEQFGGLEIRHGAGIEVDVESINPLPVHLIHPDGSEHIEENITEDRSSMSSLTNDLTPGMNKRDRSSLFSKHLRQIQRSSRAQIQLEGIQDAFDSKDQTIDYWRRNNGVQPWYSAQPNQFDPNNNHSSDDRAPQSRHEVFGSIPEKGFITSQVHINQLIRSPEPSAHHHHNTPQLALNNSPARTEQNRNDFMTYVYGRYNDYSRNKRIILLLFLIALLGGCFGVIAVTVGTKNDDSSGNTNDKFVNLEDVTYQGSQLSLEEALPNDFIDEEAYLRDGSDATNNTSYPPSSSSPTTESGGSGKSNIPTPSPFASSSQTYNTVSPNFIQSANSNTFSNFEALTSANYACTFTKAIISTDPDAIKATIYATNIGSIYSDAIAEARAASAQPISNPKTISATITAAYIKANETSNTTSITTPDSNHSSSEHRRSHETANKHAFTKTFVPTQQRAFKKSNPKTYDACAFESTNSRAIKKSNSKADDTCAFESTNSRAIKKSNTRADDTCALKITNSRAFKKSNAETYYTCTFEITNSRAIKKSNSKANDIAPSKSPTPEPSTAPPTDEPTWPPSIAPISSSPTSVPSDVPTTLPPSSSPSVIPTSLPPSVTPTVTPTTLEPSRRLTSTSPTSNPITYKPSSAPSILASPTKAPTLEPSTLAIASNPPTPILVTPTAAPQSKVPSSSPVSGPTDEPTVYVTSLEPAIYPTYAPTAA
eukprot:CAMPEP_0113374010 /NCGR_PEP_ID=MMETSP0013_2-20120614/1357_1 /TAXON_ID=2843 ORGANISM="Skeletonema costatum, Strain 1716" /NCGR_SAMPLE_ID=MMETSP0013_2 /ASSEMBLY_ACC=CAM_ASM_000158 /LENGTH=761 /DNA_ID=CAMNT_0000255975 /DNA_START=138 /DNA_END=2423 /DNA_ORIENTATION=+ /assembly_acc=CAM_ASM_000158